MDWQDRIIRCNKCYRLHPDGVLVCPPPCECCYGTGEHSMRVWEGLYSLVDCSECDGTGTDREWILMATEGIE